MTDTAAAVPVLYSFRRCPYAMRARLALSKAGVAVELREILLKDKPPAMLGISPKGTVPVLVLSDGRVIDESIEVMRWALAGQDPDDWCQADPERTAALIDEADGSFKQALDRYKYFTRYPEYSREHYRSQGEVFLAKLESQLAQHAGKGLVRASTSLADIAIFPFVRQFAGADTGWFEQSSYANVRHWLHDHVNARYFLRIMKKYPLWSTGATPIIEDWREG